jgi:hypothetical protein
MDAGRSKMDLVVVVRGEREAVVGGRGAPRRAAGLLGVRGPAARGHADVRRELGRAGAVQPAAERDADGDAHDDPRLAQELRGRRQRARQGGEAGARTALQFASAPNQLCAGLCVWKSTTNTIEHAA